MKSGWQTSEFWVTLLSLLVPSVASAFTSTGDPSLATAGLALTGIYTVARSAVKVASDVRAAAEATAMGKAADNAAAGAFGSAAPPTPIMPAPPPKV